MRTISHGEIAYLHDDRGQVGWERFQRTDHAEGAITLQVATGIEATGFIREATLALDAAYRPLDASLRTTAGGRTHLAWYHFGEREVRCEAIHHDIGRVSQVVALPQRAAFFGCHPVCVDVLVPAGCDFSTPGVREVHGIMSTRKMIGEGEGPLAYPHTVRAELEGTEEIETPAGRFLCQRIAIPYEHNGSWTQMCWVTQRHLFVRVRNEEFRSTYVLTSLRQERAPG